MTDVSRLPGPMIDAWEWQYEAACRDLDTELFFHPEGERGSTRRRRAANAKAICATCPVIRAVPVLRSGRPGALRHLGWNDRGRTTRRDPLLRTRTSRVLTLNRTAGAASPPAMPHHFTVQTSPAITTDVPREDA